MSPAELSPYVAGIILGLITGVVCIAPATYVLGVIRGISRGRENREREASSSSKETFHVHDWHRRREESPL